MFIYGFDQGRPTAIFTIMMQHFNFSVKLNNE